MDVNSWIKAIAGIFIIASVSLGYFVNEYWFFFTIFVGLNLFQSSFTKWCLLEKILIKMGVKQGGASCSV